MNNTNQPWDAQCCTVMKSPPADKCKSDGTQIITGTIVNDGNGTLIISGQKDTSIIKTDRIENDGSLTCIGGCSGRLVILL